MSITLVLGLGNPGREYADTRHNIGWHVLDALVSRENLTWNAQPSFMAETTRWDHPTGHSVLLAKPQSFMNESGQAARLLTSYFKVTNANVVLVYDDLNIDLGLIKVSVRGSAGGHNGVSDVIAKLGDGFQRFRIGIGPRYPAQMDLKDFVLGKFTSEQRLIVQQHIPTYLSGLDLLLNSGSEQAMNLLNRRDQNESQQT